MTKTSIRTAPKALALAGLLAATATSGFAQSLTIVGWGGGTQDAQREALFTPFAKTSGITLVEDSWGGGYGILQSKVAAGVPSWDVVQVEAEEEALGCMDGLYEKLDWTKIGSPDDWVEGTATECGVGTITVSTGLAYDGNKLADNPPTSWVDFFDTAKYPGKRALRKGAKYTLESALIADGVPVGEVYATLATPEGVDRAFAKLETLGSDLIWWEAGAQSIQLLLSGEVVMAAAYNARIEPANKAENANLKFVWPGNVMATDLWVIMKGTANLEAAQDAVAFMTNQENLANYQKLTAYGVPNKLIAASLSPEEAVNLPTSPANMAEALPLDVEFWIDNNESLTERFNAWLASR